jgi:type I restriction enzyme, S subunit
MNDVDFLDKLLDGVKVERKPLGDLGELVRGNGLQKKDFTETGVPAIHYGQIYTYYGLSTKETKSFVSSDLAKQLKKVNKGDVVITNTSENLEDVGKALVYLGEQQAVTGGHASILKPSECLLGKYFAYFTQTEEFSRAKRKYAKGTKVIDVSATDMAKIQIPIPCPDNPKKSLEIQAEIVRILDTFTELTTDLTTELTTELTTRKKQYNHYREQLLSFNEGVPFKRLGDIVRIKNGKDHKKLGEGEFPVYGSGGIMRYADTYAYNKPSVLIPRKGSLGNLFFLDVPFWNVDTIFYTEIDEAQILPKFLYYFLTTVGLGEMNQAGGVPSQTQSVLNELKIPVPQIKVQSEIVESLDKFDDLTNSLTKGLSREIKLRQKQYAHYRDLLLCFPKPEKVEA